MRPIFIRYSLLRFKAFFLILLSCLLMLADAKLPLLHRLRQNSQVLLFPVQYASNIPEQFGRWFYQRISSTQKLLIENAELRANNLLLQAKTQQLLQTLENNNNLRKLINSTLQFKKQHYLVASILAVDPEAPRQQVIINQGTEQHVYLGQPALTGHGVVGQVIAVTPLTSRVMLLTDPQSAIPVEDSRTHLRAIAQANRGENLMRLRYVSLNDDIKVGDLLVTSGLGLVYPAGYPVAKVVSVTEKSASQELQVMLQPQADLLKVRQLLLVWPNFPKVALLAHKQLQQTPANN